MSAKAAELCRSTLDDRDCMARLAEGDLGALGQLYDRHGEQVRRFVLRATGEHDVADDLTHETFLTLMRVAERYDPRHAPRAFLIGIAGQLVRRRRLGLAQRLRHLARFGASARRVVERTPEDVAIGSEQLVRFRQALERLSAPKRLVLVMADVEGLSGKQIAEALDIPLNTVWTRLHHARHELRTALRKAGGLP